MKKLKNYQLEVLKERGIYDIDILDEGKQLIGLTVDTIRGQYYVIKPEDEKINEDVVDAYILMKNEIIDKISDKKFNGTLVGSTKSYTKEVLDGVFTTLGIQTDESVTNGYLYK